MREQLALAAEEIIRLRLELKIETDLRRAFSRGLRGGSNPPAPSGSKPPPPPRPPPNRDVTGRNYQRPWWRRIFNRSKAA